MCYLSDLAQTYTISLHIREGGEWEGLYELQQAPC